MLKSYERSYKDIKTGNDFKVEVEINLDELAQELAARAYHSTSGRTVTLHGAIKCKVIAGKRKGNS